MWIQRTKSVLSAILILLGVVSAVHAGPLDSQRSLDDSIVRLPAPVDSGN